jgi:hypothetical protein
MSINVLTYNTSWEASQPLVDWCRNPYPYGPANKENGLGYMCGAREKHENGVLKDNDPMSNPCRKNIFELVKNGKYDLVGMQEYVHTWGGKSVYKDVMAGLENETPSMKLVWDKVRHTGIPPNGKDIEIGLLYNSERFEQRGDHVVGDFKVQHKAGGAMVDDGRPYLIVYLVDNNTGEKYVFINAHFPQVNKWKNGDITTAPLERANKELTTAVQKLLTQVNHEGEYEIILTSDTNDVKISFVYKLVINGKKMWIGKDVRNTCCTPIVKDMKMGADGSAPVPAWKKDGKPMSKWKKDQEFTRKNQRHRKGDVILYSGNKSFSHTYPVEKENEPYSDHAPVAAILKTPSEYNLGRRSPPVPRGCGAECGIQGGKRRKRKQKTRKRRRKKRTKKKAPKRRRPTIGGKRKSRRKRTGRRNQGRSKKLSTPQRTKLKKVIEFKISDQYANIQKFKMDVLKKKLGGPKKIRSTIHTSSKKRKTKKTKKTRK